MKGDSKKRQIEAQLGAIKIVNEKMNQVLDKVRKRVDLEAACEEAVHLITVLGFLLDKFASLQGPYVPTETSKKVLVARLRKTLTKLGDGVPS